MCSQNISNISRQAAKFRKEAKVNSDSAFPGDFA